MAGAICKSCTQVVTGPHFCPGFKVSTAVAAPSATASAPNATSTFPLPSLVVCTCGVTYRYGAAHSCVLNGAFFSTPAPSMNAVDSAAVVRSLQRIATALERLVDKLSDEA